MNYISESMESSILRHYSPNNDPNVNVSSRTTREISLALPPEAIDRIIEMAWEDRTTFDAIQFQFGLNEAAVKTLMKKQLKLSSYRLWRKRVNNCNMKHAAKRINGIDRFKSTLQRNITHNKISKR
jgi:uncharacterized protein (TIGR03643 family)